MSETMERVDRAPIGAHQRCREVQEHLNLALAALSALSVEVSPSERSGEAVLVKQVRLVLSI